MAWTPDPPECSKSPHTLHEFKKGYRYSCKTESWYPEGKDPETEIIDERWQCKHCGKPATDEETQELNNPSSTGPMCPTGTGF